MDRRARIEEARRRVGAAVSAVASKWWDIRENNRDASSDDASFYKGNARWANGASSELSSLPGEESVDALCEAAIGFFEARPWDGDYDEPSAARDEMIRAVRAIQAEFTREQLRATGVVERRITFEALAADVEGILDQTLGVGAVLVVDVPAVDQRVQPAGLVASNGVRFVIGPESICGRVLGLVDVEYGWPALVSPPLVAQDVVPGHRRHPVIPVSVRGQRQLAYSVMWSEYQHILDDLAAQQS